MFKTKLSSLIHLLPLLLSACGGSDSAPAATMASAAETARISAPLSFGPCPEGFVSECAHVPVPLDWDAPNGQQLPILLARRPAPAQPANAQLWLVMGGPGDSADTFAKQGLLNALSLMSPRADVYVVEHRGVGDSGRLGCPQEGANVGGVIPVTDMPACAQSLKKQLGAALNNFSTKNAALDLGSLIRATRTPDKRVVVYGVSYGTYLVQGYMKLFPDEADGVVLDSFFAPWVDGNDRYDQHWDIVAKKITDACGADPLCQSKLGADPWPRVKAAAAKLIAGGCAGVSVSRETFQQLSFEMIDDPTMREHLLPLLYRAERCSPDDVLALNNYLSAFTQSIQSTPRASDFLRSHIALSEQWPDPLPSLENVIATCRASTFCPGISERSAQLIATWPRYRGAVVTAPPTWQRPLLIMNGTFDAKNPIETTRSVASALRAPSQTLVEFPGVSHVVIARSRTTDGNPLPCGLRLLGQFVDDPKAPLDLACTKQLKTIDFTGDAATNEAMFGVADRWEN